MANGMLIRILTNVEHLFSVGILEQVGQIGIGNALGPFKDPNAMDPVNWIRTQKLK